VNLDLTACSDGELAALASAGRQSAFAEIMARHQAAIYRLVRGHVGDADEALDVTQEAFTAAYLTLRRFDENRPLRAWLARIAINKCRDWRRRRVVRRFFAFAAPLTEAAGVTDDTPDAEEAALEKEEQERLWNAISSLPAGLKEPLLLRTMEGLSTAETAELLGTTAKAIEGRMYRARARLAEILGST
jgi:RNA polymerase sigma-70 factor (ECF subfamily)